MSGIKTNASFAIFALFFAVQGLPADAPPFPAWGADAVPELYAPNLAGQGAFITGTGGAPSSAVNPAQGGDAQRIVFDAGFLGLAGMGEEEGFGNAVEIGALFPSRYGVFGGSLRLIQSPFDESFPVKTFFSGNLTAAKEIYRGMSVGMGLNFGVGDKIGDEPLWGVSADLGFKYHMGRLGPFHNFTCAAVLRTLGRSWTPTWFTPIAGASLDLIRVTGTEGKSDPFAVNVSADLGFPSLFYLPQTSMIFKAGLKFEIAEIVTVSASWPGGSGFNARETAELGQDKFTMMPSIGMGVNIALPSGGRRIAGGRLPTDGNLAIDLAYRPLYEGVTALGGGATWAVGIADKKPPRIGIEGADPGSPMYFSPNNDGKADYLEFPVSITDERYVESWVWEIRDGEGNIVRTFRNKELREETQGGLRNFFTRLVWVKKAVEVPEAFRWDGIGDSGELLADGDYTFTITATDDSGNTGTSPAYRAVLKTAPPHIAIDPMDDGQKVFSPGGGGSKNTITFAQNGSAEDAWVSGIYDAAGVKVRSFADESGSPRQRVWDGKDDSGAIVSDGVYSYRIEAVDRAGNEASATVANIVVNTIRPVIGVVIEDPWFSPNGDGIKDSLSMSLSVPVKEDVVNWMMQIRDNQNAAVMRTIRGQGSIADRFEYDGKNDAGAVLAEGAYRVTLSVSYRNGFTAGAFSPPFTLKTTAPTAAITMDYSAFSPNNGGVQNEMLIRQNGSPEQTWIADIRRANAGDGERPVRSFKFSGIPPKEVRWDGHGEAGTFASDGEYTYELYATDQAGNTGRSNTLRFRLSTVDTPVMITTDARAFAPAGNSPRTSINLNPQVNVKEGIVSYKIEVQNNTGQAIRTFEGQGLPPAAVSWNGRSTANMPVSEGFYTAKLDIRYEQGNQPSAISLPFEIDNTPPKATVSALYTSFSPNGQRGAIPFDLRSEANDSWEAAIVAANGRKIRTWAWQGPAPEVAWDGTDNAGNAAPDGTYQFTLSSADAAGNTAAYSIPGLVLDARIPRLILTASAAAIAPKANQNADMVRFGIMCSLQEGIGSWELVLKDEKGAVMRRFASPPPAGAGSGAMAGRAAPPPATIGWNGLSESGNLREGRYTPVLTVNYLKGDVATAEAPPILVQVTGPELSLSYRPEYFSPDNDGVEDELFISLGAASPAPIASWFLEIREPVAPNLLFYRIEGKGSPSAQVVWDGRSNKGELVQAATDYPVTYSATDILGNTSTIDSIIGVDVLVIRDGDRLKIQVPSIVFRENAADFNGIPADRTDNNIRVLRRIAEILNKFRDYKVQVEGHANPVARTAQEERVELQPLSEARAKMVMNMLAEFGVARGRLSAVGMGGTRPVVAFNDRDNWWKNRRVEFILIK